MRNLMKSSALAISALLLTGLGCVLFINVTTVSAATYTDSVSIMLADTDWVVNPGRTFDVVVVVRNNDNATKDL